MAATSRLATNTLLTVTHMQWVWAFCLFHPSQRVCWEEGAVVASDPCPARWVDPPLWPYLPGSHLWVVSPETVWACPSLWVLSSRVSPVHPGTVSSDEIFCKRGRVVSALVTGNTKVTMKTVTPGMKRSRVHLARRVHNLLKNVLFITEGFPEIGSHIFPTPTVGPAPQSRSYSILLKKRLIGSLDS